MAFQCCENPNIVDVLREIVNEFAKDSHIEWPKITICKRSRELKDGEFVIPKGSAPKSVEKKENHEELLHFLESNLSRFSQTHLPCERLTSDEYNIVRLHVHRMKSFSSIISQVIRSGEAYGRISSNSDNIVLLNLAHQCHQKSQTITNIRQLLVLQHSAEILKANGFQVHMMPVSEDILKLNTNTNLKLKLKLDTVKSEDADKREKVLTLLKDSKYRDNETSVQSDMSDGDGVKHVKCEPVSVNLRQFMENVSIKCGKLGYDKNLSKVEVFNGGEPTYVLDQVVNLNCYCDRVKEKIHAVVHLVPESLSFTQQQTDLVWRIIGGAPTQCHLVVGSVTGRAGQSCDQTAQDLLQLRYEQMKEASVMKYGEEVQGAAWETTLSGMTSASIAFEMLNTAPRNTVKLNVRVGDQMSSEMRSGAFVMYSCARLATLFKHFHEAVQRGTYPPLPPIEEVHFETLRDEEEWVILFNYIYHYPDLLHQCVDTLQPTPAHIHANIHTHKVGNFLVNFSRTLSSYYSRVHILGDGGSHLLPVMYARLHLVSAAHQVLKNGLALMGIQPLNQL